MNSRSHAPSLCFWHVNSELVVPSSHRLGLRADRNKRLITSCTASVQEDWEAEFAKYKQSPEYQRVNRGMGLDDFKFIYWCDSLILL